MESHNQISKPIAYRKDIDLLEKQLIQILKSPNRIGFSKFELRKALACRRSNLLLLLKKLLSEGKVYKTRFGSGVRGSPFRYQLLEVKKVIPRIATDW